MSQGLAEAFASPLTPQATTMGLAEAFANPTSIEIEGVSVTLPDTHFRMSEEEQAKALEGVATQIRKQKEERAKFQESIMQMEEGIKNAPSPEDNLDEFTKDAVGSFPGFFPGAYAGAKTLSALAPSPLLKPGMALVGGLGGGFAGSSVTGPYVRAVTDPMVDGAKDFVENKTVLGQNGLQSLGDDFGQGLLSNSPSIVSDPYDSSSTGVLAQPPTPLLP